MFSNIFNWTLSKMITFPYVRVPTNSDDSVETATLDILPDNKPTNKSTLP